MFSSRFGHARLFGVRAYDGDAGASGKSAAGIAPRSQRIQARRKKLRGINHLPSSIDDQRGCFSPGDEVSRRVRAPTLPRAHQLLTNCRTPLRCGGKVRAVEITHVLHILGRRIAIGRRHLVGKLGKLGGLAFAFLERFVDELA